MSSSRLKQICGSLAVLSLLTACATTPEDPSAGAQATQDTALLPKPTSQEIESIGRASALEQANFWNRFYNIHPTDLQISLEFSRALRGIKSFDRATEVATFTSITFPDNVEAFTELGRSQRGNNKPVEAVKAYGRVVELAPYDAAPFAAMGSIYDAYDDHETAQLAYAKALALDPDRPATLANLGLSLALTGELERAEETLSKAAAYPDATAQIRQNYALILGLRGKFEEARRIAAIDAPGDIADRNTDFLKQMIGHNPQLQALAENPGQSRSAPPRPIQTPVETPAALPTETVQASALGAIGKPDEDATSTEIAELAGQPAQAQANPQLKLRTRDRRQPSGGQ